MNAKAIIFDMDGVIIDSEPLWCQAQIEALASYGQTVSMDECETLTRGKRLDEIASVWCNYLPLSVASSDLETAIRYRITDLISEKGEIINGVNEVLSYFCQLGYRIALATSSSHQVITAVLNKLNLWHYFDIISSADDEEYGKPHPAVYLTTLQKLNLPAADCIVIEDSLNGFHAAQAAGIRTLVVAGNCQHPNFQTATGRYSSMQKLLKTLDVQPLAVADNHILK